MSEENVSKMCPRTVPLCVVALFIHLGVNKMAVDSKRHFQTFLFENPCLCNEVTLKNMGIDGIVC